MIEVNLIESSLRRTSKSLRTVFEELGLDIETFDLSKLTIDQCGNCDIWYNISKLHTDHDGNYICGFCLANIGE